MLEAISYFNPWADKGTLRDLNKIETWQKVGPVALSGIEAIVIVAVARQVSSISNYVLVPLAGLCAFATFRALIERAVADFPLPPPQIEMTANHIFWGRNADPSFDAKAFEIRASFNGSSNVQYGYVEDGNNTVTLEMLRDDAVAKFKTSHGLDVEGKKFRLILSSTGYELPLNRLYSDLHEEIKQGCIWLIATAK